MYKNQLIEDEEAMKLSLLICIENMMHIVRGIQIYIYLKREDNFQKEEKAQKLTLLRSQIEKH